MTILRQSTSQVIRFGPFSDSTDGVTPETGLTIAQADMQLSKDGGAFAQKNAAGNATHDTDGWYSTTLDTTDTNTVGVFILQVNVSGAIPVWHTYYVVEEAIYDALYAASATGFNASGQVVVATNNDKTGYSISGTKTTLDALNDVAATDIVSAGAITTSSGAVSNVTTVATTTTNTDMRGTDSAALASTIGTPAGASVSADIASVKNDTSVVIPDIVDDLAIKRNTDFSNFEFLMVLTSDGRTPATGLTVTGERSINGGPFAFVSGTIAEVSNGIYQFDALAADTNGDVITWRFSAATADDTFITFKTVQ